MLDQKLPTETSGSYMTSRSKFVLSVGFLSVAVAVAVAATNPATGYEGSIYAATPDIVWPLLAVALAAGISEVWSRRVVIRRLGIALIAGAISTVIFLPFIRGYRYLGEYDSLSQLGWARSLEQGTVGTTDLFYPLLHNLAVTIDLLTGMGLERALLFTPFAFAIVYVLSIVLVVRQLSVDDSYERTVIATVSGLLLLPIVLIRVPVLQPIPATASILFFPLVLYIYFRTTRQPVWRLLAFVAIVSLLFYHPQQAFNFSVLVLALGIYGSVAKRTDRLPVPPHAPSVPQLSFAGVIIVWWILTQPAFVNLIAHMVDLITSPGTLDATAGGDDGVQPHVNVPLLIVKLFSISTLYGLFASEYSIRSLFSAIRPIEVEARSETDIERYRVFELVVIATPLVALTGLFLVSGRTNQIFRYVGLGLVFVTIIGSISLYETFVWLCERAGERSAKRAFQIGFLVLLLLSVPLVHPSSYISKPTDHVTEQKLSGYESTFEYTTDERPITTLYSPANRYRDATFGRQENRFGIGVAPSNDVLADDPPPIFDSEGNVSTPYYMVTTKADRYYAIQQYHEQQYTRSQFEAVASNETVSRIYSSGEFNLSLVRNERDSARDS